MMITNKKGYSLLEMILVLSIASAVSFMKFRDLKHDQENILASTVGQQIKQVGEAVNGYINIHYDKLEPVSNSV
nr:prepilin-type N-terminal cleavage/methylation domain-containing protein [Pantoea stewartii]